MKNEKRSYTFSKADLRKVIAHNGKGTVNTIRVEHRREGSAFSFIDLTEIPPKSSIGVHTHKSDDEEVYVIISGKGRMFSAGEFFEVEAGDVIVNSPGGTHALENIGPEPLKLVVLDVNVTTGIDPY
jgi:mannose-6-phosphate isomerase-like protein (cupin superfamily)